MTELGQRDGAAKGERKRHVLFVFLSVLGIVLCLVVWQEYFPHARPHATLPRGVPRDNRFAGKTVVGDDGQFVEVAQEAGIHYRWTIEGKRPINILQGIGNGCAFLDYNNDGNLDILLVGPQLALYKGDGHGHFTDVTQQMGLDKLHGHFLGCAVGDYDNDGYEDIYLSAYRGGVLLHNEKGNVLRDVTAEAGIQAQPWGTSCTFVDVDGDGKLDLYICNYLVFGPNTQPQLCPSSGIFTVCNPRVYRPEQGVLYHNEGHGKFRDITQAWGAQHVTGKSLGVAAADFDGSGRQSLAIANDGVAGDLLQNRGGQFTNIGARSGTAFDPAGKVHAGMGLDWGDYDNDGKLDLVVATFGDEPKSLYHNEGGGLFTDQARPLGLTVGAWPYVAFGVKFLDYDNDGFLDLIFANGHIQDNAEQISLSSHYRQRIKLFHNRNGVQFEDVSKIATYGLYSRIVGRGLAVGDYDNDGRMDVLIVDGEGAPLLLHNQVPHPGHWLLLKLIGTKSNHDGLGALVTAEAGGRKMLYRCATDGSYMSASDRRVHLGLGDSTWAKLTVQWPSGTITTYAHVNADHIVTLREGDPTPH